MWPRVGPREPWLVRLDDVPTKRSIDDVLVGWFQALAGCAFPIAPAQRLVNAWAVASMRYPFVMKGRSLARGDSAMGARAATRAHQHARSEESSERLDASRCAARGRPSFLAMVLRTQEAETLQNCWRSVQPERAGGPQAAWACRTKTLVAQSHPQESPPVPSRSGAAMAGSLPGRLSRASLVQLKHSPLASSIVRWRYRVVIQPSLRDSAWRRPNSGPRNG